MGGEIIFISLPIFKIENNHKLVKAFLGSFIGGSFIFGTYACMVISPQAIEVKQH